MADEQILEPTENKEPKVEPKVDDPRDSEIAKLKARLSEVNSEAASWKKQLRALQSEEEVKKAEQEERYKEMESKLAEFEKNANISKFTSSFMESGIDAELSKTMANAFADGDMETVFASLKTHTDNIKKSAVAMAMANQSGMSTGKADIPQVTKEQFNAMSYTERISLKAKDPALYESLVKGE